LLLELLLEEAVELALEVDVLEPLVARLLGVGDEDERSQGDPLVAAQGQLRFQGEPQLDLLRAREGRRRRGEETQGEGRRARSTEHWRPSPSSSCTTCRTRRNARSCGGCSCRWERARGLSCTPSMRARSRRWLPARRRGCCARARCPELSRSPA